MFTFYTRLAATLAILIVTISAAGSALARSSAGAEPAPPEAPAAASLLLRGSDVPGLVTYTSASGRLSLWESAERENGQRAVLRRAHWRGGARRTFGQSTVSLYGVLSIESRVFVFADAKGAKRALPRLAPSGLHLASGRLPLVGGARVYMHEDTVEGISELALATQFRQRNVISRVMIVGTPGIIDRSHLLATARRQAMRVAQALT
ncbi:MAG TPA: hypothetical protein VFD90_03850 [Gaiellales bacterium]|jgi:hypothetical protein|nr:hypothetical protein [Gaiellales bacterium]